MKPCNFGALLLSVLLCGAAPLEAAPYSALYVFGDSYSDNGNLPPAFWPPPPYLSGRFSNGPVAAEYLAADLGVGLFDYALGGATTGLGNVGLPVGGGVLAEVENFAATHPRVDPAALYMVWAGLNDFLHLVSPSQISGAIATAVGNLVNEVGILHGLGAEHVFVPAMFDLGLIPLGQGNPAASPLSFAFNSALDAALPDYVTRFDSFGFMHAIVADPSAYGFSNVTDPCFSLLGECAAPDSSLFWDVLHPTTRAHQLLAAAFATALPEPSPLALLLLGGLLAMFATAPWRPVLRRGRAGAPRADVPARLK